MKIALLNVFIGRDLGGTARYVAALSAELSRRHEIHLFATTFGKGIAPAAVQHRFPSLPPTNFLENLAALWYAGRAVKKKLDYDLVHGQGVNSPVADVSTIHVCHTARYRAVVRAHVHKKRWPLRWGSYLERRFYPRFPALIAISDKVEGELKRYFPDHQGVNRIYHAVGEEFRPPASRADTRALLVRRYGVPAAEPWLLFVGGEFLIKGLDRVLELTRLLRPRFPRLWILGNDRLSRWQKEAERLGVADRIVWTGFQPDPVPFYQAADLLLLPSYYDAFGFPALEAMACGCPALVSDRTGVAELIRHEHNGLVVGGDTPVATWIPSLARILSTPPFWSSLSREALTAARRHSWARVAEATERVYEEVLRGRSRPLVGFGHPRPDPEPSGPVR